MAGRKYPQVEPGQWVAPNHDGYKMSCCDCGLVHMLQFRVTDDGQVELRAWRDNRATGQVRRHRGITVTH